MTSINPIVLLTIDINSYLYPQIENAVKKHLPASTRIVNNTKDLTPEELAHSKIFQYAEYEDLDFDRLNSDPKYLACSFVYRKGLIRKHYLANTIALYTAKNPDSILKRAFPESFNIEVDYAEFLDDSLDEAYELRQELEENATKDMDQRNTWILKPSMSDRGQGIRLFQTIPGLQKIFDDFEGSDDEEEVEEENHNIMTSQLRHFIVQQYIGDALLLPHYKNRKFHIRTYVLCVGALKVYVYNNMLALFALSPYVDPKSTKIDDEGDAEEIPMLGHLTNTCLQGEQKDATSVTLFSQLVGLSDSEKSKILAELCTVTGELFKAAVSGGSINFQPLPNAFEIYGLDFLVTKDHGVKLLEVNAYPDFKQTGDELVDVITQLFDQTVETAVKPFFDQSAHGQGKDMTLVYDKQLSGGW